MEAQPGSLAHKLQTEYDDWFKRLQALTNKELSPDDWTGRWYDGYTPAEALADGPDED